MNRKYIPMVLLAGTILALSASEAAAHGLRSRCGAVCGSCGGYAESCCATPCSAPAPAPMVKQKVMVTEYFTEEYEATRTVCKMMTREETYTAYKCEMVPVTQKRMVTVYKSMPKTVEKVVMKCEMVSTVEERTVTRMVSKTVPVTSMVTRCVEKGGSYQCREVPCQTTSNGCGSRGGLFRHRRGCDSGCGGCEAACAPATMLVSVYVPNYVTEQVPVTTYKTVCQPVTEKINVNVCKMVQRPEKVQVTVMECVPQTKEEVYTVYQQKMTPYPATRKVCYMQPVLEKYKAMRCVPRTVEKEVYVCTSTCDTGCASCGGCGAESCGRRGGLLRRCR